MFAAAKFVEKCLSRLGELGGVGLSEIYKVTVVRQYLCRSVAALLAVFLERFGFLVGYLFGFPARRIAGKQRKCFGSYGTGVEGRFA